MIWTVQIKRELEEMPMAHMFYLEDGNRELCNSTGYEVSFGNGEWWCEYEDSKGDLHYGR